jgi:hypothetical protein
MGTATAGSAGAMRRGVFEVDTGRVLEALRLAWGDAYVVAFDDALGAGEGRWQAWRRSGEETMLAGSTPDELTAAIRADCASRRLP